MKLKLIIGLLLSVTAVGCSSSRGDSGSPAPRSYDKIENFQTAQENLYQLNVSLNAFALASRNLLSRETKEEQSELPEVQVLAKKLKTAITQTCQVKHTNQGAQTGHEVDTLVVSGQNPCVVNLNSSTDKVQSPEGGATTNSIDAKILNVIWQQQLGITQGTSNGKATVKVARASVTSTNTQVLNFIADTTAQFVLANAQSVPMTVHAMGALDLKTQSGQISFEINYQLPTVKYVLEASYSIQNGKSKMTVASLNGSSVTEEKFNHMLAIPSAAIERLFELDFDTSRFAKIK